LFFALQFLFFDFVSPNDLPHFWIVKENAASKTDNKPLS